jgi:hypothetical protein
MKRLCGTADEAASSHAARHIGDIDLTVPKVSIEAESGRNHDFRRRSPLFRKGSV